MDPVSLDSIEITEDKDGSGGFDLNLIEPPEEYQQETIKTENIDSEQKAEAESKNVSLFQNNTGPDLTNDIEVGNDDIQISLEDSAKNLISVDLFGFDNNNLHKDEDLPVDDTPEVEIDIKETGEHVVIADLENEDNVKKTIHPEESLTEDLEPSWAPGDYTNKLQGEQNVGSLTNSLDDDGLQDAGISLADMGMGRLRHDSSSGSEFDFELPPVKRKTEDTVKSNDTAQQPIKQVEQKLPDEKMAGSVIQPQSTNISATHTDVTSTVTTVNSTTKKIIEYKDESPNDILPPSNSQKKAADDWANVQTIEAGFMKEGEKVQPTLPQSTPLLSYYEMQETVFKTDFTSAKTNIHSTVERHGFSALKHFIFGPPKMNRNLLPNREVVFCIAASSFSNSNSTHTRALQTIYRSLTGSRFDCSRFGSHWEEIGFQGNDPSTDLRGAGLLGLMNLIYLLRHPKCHVISKDIYKLSLHPTQNFPFCVMGINMSRITLQTLREDCLNKECNRRKDVIGVVNDFYAGLYLQMYQVWKSQGKTISDSGYVIKHLETEAKKNPHHVLKNLEDYLKNKKSSVNLDNMDPGGDNFLSVCETEAGQY